jgi:DivIVA domain-containing protein
VGTFLGWVVAALVVGGVLFGVAAALTGRADDMADMPRDAAPPELPADRPLNGDDVRGLRFEMAFRGYRMADVDAVLDRVAEDIAWRDAEIARLRTPVRDEQPDG